MTSLTVRVYFNRISQVFICPDPPHVVAVTQYRYIDVLAPECLSQRGSPDMPHVSIMNDSSMVNIKAMADADDSDYILRRSAISVRIV